MLIKKLSQNSQLKLKFGAKTNLNMQNSVVLFTFPAFDWKYPFGANFILEIEVWYLEFSNMQNSAVAHFFPILTRYNLFGWIWSKKSKLSKFGTLANSNMQSSLLMFTFSVYGQKKFFGQIWSKKIKLLV